MKVTRALSIILLCVFIAGFTVSCNDIETVSSVPSIEQQEKQYGTSPPGNSYDVGRAVELDGYLYYGEKYLSKVKLDGSERTRIKKEWSSIYELNAYKDWIYCKLTFEYEHQRDGIYRISKDLSQCELIKRGEGICSILIYGDDIYYVDGNGTLCKCKVDGSETSIISERSGLFQPYGDYIYMMIRENTAERPLALPKLYRVKNDGTGFELFLDAEMNCFYVYDNKVLYNDSLDNYSLYSMDLDTKEKEKIIDDNVNGFFYKYNTIFYRNTDDMYAYNLEKSTTTKVSKTLVFMESMCGDYIYFQTAVRNPSIDRICIKDGIVGEQTTFMKNLFELEDF